MINVLHYDYKPHDKVHAKFIKRIQELFGQHPQVNYHFMPGFHFLCDVGHLERLLPGQDILLIHPGVEGQGIIAQEYPILFPNLEIGILSHTHEHYKGGPAVTVLDYQKPEEIVKFALSAGQRK